jgi:hypothetical protein
MMKINICAIVMTLTVTLDLSSAALIRGPYLQRNTSTNVVVCWRTDVAESSQVKFGTNVSDLNMMRTNASSALDHFVNIKPLTPNTKYYYSIGKIGAAAAGNSNVYFKTGPTLGTAHASRIWVIGDSGKTTNEVWNVRNKFVTWNADRHIDAFLMLGDNVYDGPEGDHGSDPRLTIAVFNTFSGILKKTVLWSTLGNHDADGDPSLPYSSSSRYAYYKAFNFPTQGECGGIASGKEDYYV